MEEFVVAIRAPDRINTQRQPGVQVRKTTCPGGTASGCGAAIVDTANNWKSVIATFYPVFRDLRDLRNVRLLQLPAFTHKQSYLPAKWDLGLDKRAFIGHYFI
jgi:hypothetical protein